MGGYASNSQVTQKLATRLLKLRMSSNGGEYTGVEEGLIMTDGVISLDGLAALLICCCKFDNEAVEAAVPVPGCIGAIEDAEDTESLFL